MFIREHYSERVLRAYNQINPLYGQARADFFRYLLLYRVGGVYLDIKSGVQRPLEEVLGERPYLLTRWDNAGGGEYPGWGRHFGGGHPLAEVGEFQQWHVTARPGCDLLAAVIGRVLGNLENYSPEKLGTGKWGVILTTGPVAYSLALLPMIGAVDLKRIATNREAGLVYNTLEGDHGRFFHSAKRPHYSRLQDPVVLR